VPERLEQMAVAMIESSRAFLNLPFERDFVTFFCFYRRELIREYTLFVEKMTMEDFVDP
jgi:hypothetical protein